MYTCPSHIAIRCENNFPTRQKLTQMQTDRPQPTASVITLSALFPRPQTSFTPNPTTGSQLGRPSSPREPPASSLIPAPIFPSLQPPANQTRRNLALSDFLHFPLSTLPKANTPSVASASACLLKSLRAHVRKNEKSDPWQQNRTTPKRQTRLADNYEYYCATKRWPC